MSARAIEIKRTKQYANKARTIAIYINNKKLGTIKDGETKTFEVNTDENEIYAKIDWCKTKPIHSTIKENETIKLELGSTLSGLKLFLGIYYIIFNTSDYLYLNRQ